MKEKFLNIAAAARTIGLQRSALQQMIQEGELESFEGKLKLSDLQEVCPRAENLDTSKMLEKTRFIKDNAYTNRMRTAHMPDVHTLFSQVKKLRLELKLEKQYALRYLLALNELRDNLQAAREQCEGEKREFLSQLLQNISHSMSDQR